jgi:uncharacterized protein
VNRNIANRGEIAFAFDCHGDELIGFIHEGGADCDIGVLTLVAGGPQYRGGVGRQLVKLGRRLASEGISVMRFDYRGLGDSEGTFRGFRALQDDIAAALDVFRARAPHVRGVILWGGCDAATAALMNAHKFPEVICVIAGNPFVGSTTAPGPGVGKHYIARLLQASFWAKLARLEYALGDYAAAALGTLWKRSDRARSKAGKTSRDAEAGVGFVDELLTGLRLFEGKVLFLMGDRFLRSDEFDALVQSTPAWRSVYGKSTHQRIDIRGGDQVFSGRAAQDLMFDAASEWIHRTYPEAFRLDHSTWSTPTAVKSV